MIFILSEDRDKFLTWVQSEEIDPMTVANDGTFSVWKGRVSWNEIVRSTTQPDKALAHKDEVVTVRRNKRQRFPLPDGWEDGRYTVA